MSYKGYISDTAEKFDDVGTSSTDSANAGFKKRMKMFEKSKWV